MCPWCTSSPPDVSPTSSELMDLVDSVLFPPSLSSSPPDVSSPTSSELTDLVDSVLFPPSLSSSPPVVSSLLAQIPNARLRHFSITCPVNKQFVRVDGCPFVIAQW